MEPVCVLGAHVKVFLQQFLSFADPELFHTEKSQQEVPVCKKGGFGLRKGIGRKKEKKGGRGIGIEGGEERGIFSL